MLFFTGYITRCFPVVEARACVQAVLNILGSVLLEKNGKYVYNISDIFKVTHDKLLFSKVVLVLNVIFISLQINVLITLVTKRI